MAMARLLVSARGYARPDFERRATLPVHSDEVRVDVPNEVLDEIHKKELSPELAALAAAEAEAQTATPAIAEAVAEATRGTVPETIAPTAEPALLVELAAQKVGSADHMVETTVEALFEAMAATETPVRIARGKPSRRLLRNQPRCRKQLLRKSLATKLPIAEVSRNTASDVTSEVMGEIRDESTGDALNEIIAEASALVETPARPAAETLLETASEACETSPSMEPAEIAALSESAAPKLDAPDANVEPNIEEVQQNVEHNVHASGDAVISAPLPESAATTTANQVEPADALPLPAPLQHADPMLAEEIAAEITPAIADEIMEAVVAGLESKSEIAAQIVEPLHDQESPESLSDISANTVEAATESIPDVSSPSPSPSVSSSPVRATREVAPPAVFTGASSPYEIAPAPLAEIAPPPVGVAPAEGTPISESLAHRADSETPAAALAEILPPAAAEAAPVATPPAPISAVAPTVPHTAPTAPKEVSTKPSSVAPRSKDARMPAADLSRKSAKGDKPKNAGHRDKASPTMHDSMQGFSLRQITNPGAVPAAARSALPVKAPAVHLPGWGAQVLKFAIGVGVGCCLVAGAFVSIIVLGPGHRPRSLADARANRNRRSLRARSCSGARCRGHRPQQPALAFERPDPGGGARRLAGTRR